MIAGVKAMAVTKQIVLREWAKRPGMILDDSRQGQAGGCSTLLGLAHLNKPDT